MLYSGRKRFSAFLRGLLLFTAAALPVYSDSADFVKFERGKAEFRKGMTYFNDGHYLAAVEFFRNALVHYADYTAAADYLSRSYRLAGFLDSAVSELERLVEMYPENAVFRNRLNEIKFREAFAGKAPFSGRYVRSTVVESSKMKQYGFPHPADIAVDREKNIYVTSFSSGKLVKFDLNGNGIFSVTPGFGSGLYGVDCSGSRLAVSDFKNDRVFLMSTSGKVIKEIGRSGSGPSEFHGPAGLKFDAAGNLYVADTGNDRIQKFDPDGGFILQFGKSGKYEGELSGPSAVSVIEGLVYIADRKNSRISLFDEWGNFKKNLLEKKLDSPRGISVHGGSLLISDERKGLVKYDPATGDVSPFEAENGEENIRLFATAADRDGFVYCLDYSAQSVYAYTPVERKYTNLEVEIASVDTGMFPVVACYVNIRNREGRPVYGLTSENIKIVEDNAPVSSIYTGYLKKKAPSVSAVICVDRSTQSRRYSPDVEWAADFFLKKMRKNDSVRTVGFSSDYYEASPYDWSRRRTLKALSTDEYSSGKVTGRALYNSISSLIPRLNRRAVILITDGTVAADSFEQYSERTIIHYAQRHFVPVYIISFKSPDESLRNIAESTGGSVILPSEVDTLRSLYSRIKGQDEYRYVFVYKTFKPAIFRGWWSDMRIDIDYRGLRGTEWGGYFVP